MSEDDTRPTDEEAEATPTHDASLKVETSTLGADEMSFAEALGFGNEEPPPEPAKAEKPRRTKPTPAETASPVQAQSEVTAKDAEPEAQRADLATGAVGSEAQESVSTGEPDSGEDIEETDDVEATEDGDAADEDALAAAPPEPPPEDAVEPAEVPHEGWEEVHPRPASEGMQETLKARASALLERQTLRPPDGALGTGGSGAGVDDGLVAELRAELESAEAALSAAQVELATRDAELSEANTRLAEAAQNGRAETEKELEQLRAEMETLSLEHDQLIDQLSAVNGRLVQSDSRNEELRTSLRAARSALIPLPEGERALRAEVLGLRSRLEELGQANVQLAAEVASIATELALATARAEDRQHEADYHTDRVEDLERALLEKEAELTETVVRHRETLDLASRLQAENKEFRSIQAALEETLQARDLEIDAREEHLRVTREGLGTRDRQTVDLEERLAELRQEKAALTAQLERGEIDRTQLSGRLARREERITTLTETLERIEAAMGKPSRRTSDEPG